MGVVKKSYSVFKNRVPKGLKCTNNKCRSSNLVTISITKSHYQYCCRTCNMEMQVPHECKPSKIDNIIYILDVVKYSVVIRLRAMGWIK